MFGLGGFTYLLSLQQAAKAAAFPNSGLSAPINPNCKLVGSKPNCPNVVLILLTLVLLVAVVRGRCGPFLFLFSTLRMGARVKPGEGGETFQVF